MDFAKKKEKKKLTGACLVYRVEKEKTIIFWYPFVIVICNLVQKINDFLFYNSEIKTIMLEI